MDILTVPPPVREKLGNEGATALMTMFADAHRIALESFEHRLSEETAKLRLDIADLKFELLKWNFLFWIGQLAALVGVLRWMLPAGR